MGSLSSSLWGARALKRVLSFEGRWLGVVFWVGNRELRLGAVVEVGRVGGLMDEDGTRGSLEGGTTSGASCLAKAE